MDEPACCRVEGSRKNRIQRSGSAALGLYQDAEAQNTLLNRGVLEKIFLVAVWRADNRATQRWNSCKSMMSDDEGLGQGCGRGGERGELCGDFCQMAPSSASPKQRDSNDRIILIQSFQCQLYQHAKYCFKNYQY